MVYREQNHTHSEKKKSLKAQRPEITTLEEAIAYIEVLEARLEKLEAIVLKLTEKNDNDDTGSPWFKSNLKKKIKKKKGPEKGHPAFFRNTPDEVDDTKVWTLDSCPDCGHDLSGCCFEEQTHYEEEIIPQQKIMREHIIHRKWCSCCKKNVRARPPHLLQQTSYGVEVHLQAAYGKYGHGLTLPKLKSFFSEVCDITFSTGTISGILSRVGRYFDPLYVYMGQGLSDEPFLHADESGWRVEGQNYWIWCFTGKNVVYYHIDKSRGQKVVNSILGAVYNGILLSDFFGSYNAIDCQKQKCLVHLLRDCRKALEKYNESEDVQCFFKVLKRLCQRAIVLKTKQKILSEKSYQNSLNRVRKALMDLAYEKWQHAESIKIAKRIRKFRKELFTFLETNLEIPGHNNPAEIQIRPAVLMRKISYTNRSDKGANNQEILMSMIQSCRKAKVDFFEWARSYLRIYVLNNGPPDDLSKFLPGNWQPAVT